MSWSMRCWRRADHDLPIGLERLLERRRVVALDAVDDGRLVDAGSISRAAAIRAASVRPSCSSPIARIASASRPSNARSPTSSSYRSRPRAQSSVPPASDASSQSRYVGERRPGAVAAVQPPPIGVGEIGARRDDLVEERRQVAGRLDLEPLPEANLRHGRPGSCDSSRKRRDGLEPPGDRARGAREAARSPGRRGGTGRRRSRRARSTGAPRSGRPRCRRSSRRRLWISRSRSNRGRRPTGRRGRSPRSSARWAFSAASSARRASRVPSPRRCVLGVDAEVRARRSGCRG